jgi:acyl phosphate:glycerol-3-phosphate acyltransferase
VPVGLLVGRARGIDDIRKYGSGNIGASNVLRVIGVKAGLLVWVADALKGLLPVLASALLLDQPAITAATAVAAISGHCFSPYLRLTGGRGVSTSLGVIIGLDWRVGLICFAFWIAIVAITRYISLGSMVGCALAAPTFALLHGRTTDLIAASIIALIVIVRHAPNVGRLLNGTERKIGQREKAEGAEETGGEPGGGAS